MNLSVMIERLPHASDLPLPEYETKFSAGLDLRAALEEKEITLNAGDRTLIPTGLKIALPAGFEAQIRPRSGLAIKSGISLVNSPGTIDSDYRGEVKVIVINHGKKAFTITHGDRIAQMVIAPVTRVKLTETKKLPGSERGDGGFGSTGVK